jgi:hypothetical protein
MFGETPNDSRCDADLFGFCEFSRPASAGISETPAAVFADTRLPLHGRLRLEFLESLLNEADVGDGPDHPFGRSNSTNAG